MDGSPDQGGPSRGEGNGGDGAGGEQGAGEREHGEIFREEAIGHVQARECFGRFRRIIGVLPPEAIPPGELAPPSRRAGRLPCLLLLR